MVEKRKHSRSVVEIPIAFQVKDGPRMPAVCSDISLGGMFIGAPAGAAFGDEVTVFMQLPGLKDEVVVKAKVRWTEPEGMGVQLGTMGARATYALTKLLAASKPRTGSSP